MKTTFESELKKIQRNTYILARSDIKEDHPRGVSVLDDIFDFQLINLFKDRIKYLEEKGVLNVKKGFHDVTEFYE